MELAALATAAVPGLTPSGVAPIPDEPEDFDSAMVIDDTDHRWRVRAPRHEEASMRLERELTALQAFSPAIRAELPFLIPSVAGTIRQGALRTFVYNHVQGTHYDLDGMAVLGDARKRVIHRDRRRAAIPNPNPNQLRGLVPKRSSYRPQGWKVTTQTVLVRRGLPSRRP